MKKAEPSHTLPAMKRYKSHKVVEAAKIERVRLQATLPRKALLGFGEDEHVEVDEDYLRKHRPQVGGYYVRYADGYESWSPAEAFEAGYTAVADPVSP